MNSLKKGLIVCAIASTQLLLNANVLATEATSHNISEAFYSEAEPYNEAELAQILAPIALYPDSLLSHIVIASTYPLEVVEASRWLEQNENLDSATAVEQAEKKGWDPSVAALVAFPSVLERLNDDLQWTQNLGNAFLHDEESVLNAIQSLRQQAEQAESLNNLQNMKVTKVNQHIVIEPVQKEIIYVPYYDTRAVYGKWRWNLYPPIYWHHRPLLSVSLPGNISARFQWGGGINIRFNYFFSGFKWNSRHLVVTNHRNSARYRSFSRMASSKSVARWQHKPRHSKGLAFRSSKHSRSITKNNNRAPSVRKVVNSQASKHANRYEKGRSFTQKLKAVRKTKSSQAAAPLTKSRITQQNKSVSLRNAKHKEASKQHISANARKQVNTQSKSNERAYTSKAQGRSNSRQLKTSKHKSTTEKKVRSMKQK